MTAHATAVLPGARIDSSATRNNHQRLVTIISVVAAALFVLLALYGHDYYLLSPAERAFSPKHQLLKPSGIIGINLAFLAVALLCGIFLYPLRKRWRWLQRQGESRHWLDFHVVLGVMAPVCVAFHASFKVQGLAGIAFWVMVAVSVSGLVGRYLYAQVLREVAAAESSLLCLRELLQRQRTIAQADLLQLSLPLPTPQRVAHWSAVTALAYMVVSDLARPFRVAQLRMRMRRIATPILSLWGLLPMADAKVEAVISLAGKQVMLSRRLLLLTHAQRVFRLWHFVHRPFTYAFAVLALVHIGVAMLLGFV